MALKIDTFSNQNGRGFSFFKAVGHPLTAEALDALLTRLAGLGPVALYDPMGHLGTLAELHDLGRLTVADVFVQAIERIGEDILGHPARPVTELPTTTARSVLVAGFDAGRAADHIRHLLPAGVELVTLDAVRLPDAMLTNRRNYLDPLNFATNHGFLRDAGGRHTRLVTANYWAGYGGTGLRLWLRLFDADGGVLATWEQPLGDGVSGIVIDSAEVRRRFGLGEFTGTLFVHAIGARGHDVVKYAVDTYGDAEDELSCTHDANAWPADLYAGLPAPKDGERVTLWLQNAHPSPVPAGAIGLNLMGRDEIRPFDEAIPGFGCRALDPAALFPDERWPAQFELQAGKHVVRPRYEILAGNRRNRIAHVNVERVDLKPDPRIAEASRHLGKGWVLPAPILPLDRYRSFALPTPMSTAQTRLPLQAVVYDADGIEAARHRFGVLARSDSVAIEAGALVNGSGLPSGYGHLELIYDFEAGANDAPDGWLHGLFRYEDTRTGHAADTSFGGHVFNGVLTFKGEPQSYGGPPPGLSTRLFLRLGHDLERVDTLCHLIYPASTPWHAVSATDLILTSADGETIAHAPLAIPCGGSRLWRASETFAAEDLARAGGGGYVLIRDTTCRLFGYHGLIRDGAAFSLDHMFGF
ncbi:hypothetical protein GCM10017083_32370 [Thalassobaculum fulvum]|uniref:Uncharacterized protein n=1 Tax=Thalassobaculum fulvum TaxID=1633335 RepID=A0A918XTG0_9PROT|nr:hypothetical protein [Thalassobaculum fulvum]GHD54635.1 hypothetical protein GCM10017083_32370 [Thalassobaculum fulvum]